MIGHLSQRGGILLLTGPVSLDEYWRPTGRMQSMLGMTALRNVLREERLIVDGRPYRVSFGGNRIAELNAETPVEARGVVSIHRISVGNGTLMWCPLPIELNDHTEPIAAVYRHAMEQAGVEVELVWRMGGDLPGIYGRKLQFREGALFILVSEYASDAEIEIADPLTSAAYRFRLESERSVLFAADRTGRVIAICRPEEVAVQSG